MRISTSSGLAGLICAGICAFQLHSLFIDVGTWRSTVVNAVKSWGSNGFIEGRCQDWPLSRRACTRRRAAGWDILYHVGGNGPWIQKVDGTLGEDIEPPVGCKVEQVHMVSDSIFWVTVSARGGCSEKKANRKIILICRCRGTQNGSKLCISIPNGRNSRALQHVSAVSTLKTYSYLKCWSIKRNADSEFMKPNAKCR